VNYAEIVEALREFVARERIELLPLALESGPISSYRPIQKYVLDLKNVTKPETAAEDLFTALCKDVLGFQPTRQVGTGEGWVDFMLPERKGEPLPLELKPLFQRDGPDALWRGDANPKQHVAQVKKYLRDHEYLILTDLRTAWFFNARDYFFDNKPFGDLPFPDFLARCRETGSVLDTLRRLEDTADKPELAQQFFEDLKIWFAEFAKVRWTPEEQAAESIILLINKLIFARTIEDFGLVHYRFTQDEYARFIKLWEPKGAHRVVPKFLDFFEEFFDEYYDTEIFSTRIWNRLDQAPANLQRFCEKLNFVLGIGAWDQAFSRGIVHYNYRRIDEDIFGKSYEMFLAANRKDEGIYYTPASITAPMAESLVNSLAGKLVDDICAAVGSQQCDFARAEQLMAQLAEIRVADTACGSGGFLIKVLRCFWQQYQRIDQASGWVQKILRPENGELYLAELPPNVEAALGFRRRQNLDNRRVLIAQILLRHIFGVDKDSGAIEVAKTNIWKEAVKLSPADYNYRLLKTDVVRILPNLELNFHSADSLVDVELDKQAAWLAEYHRAELKTLSDLRARYIANPMQHEPLDEALALRKQVRADLVEHFQGENLPCEPAGFVLHFWPCWFDGAGKPRVGQASRLSPAPAPESANETGNKPAGPPTPPAGAGGTPALPCAGFDGIIGNPPWEGFKPIRKEFAARFHLGKAQFSKMGMDGPAFDNWFAEELEANPEFAVRWREHEQYYQRQKEYLGRTFNRQGTGDWNLFKLFIERDLTLVRQGGQFSLLVPSGFQTDEGCADLRRWFITEHRLDELTSFENRGYSASDNGKDVTKHIFPDVDSRFKFGFFKVVKGAVTPKGHAFDARFYLHDPKDVLAQPIRYSLEMVSSFSPGNLAFMEFRSSRDYDLGRKIRGNHALLGTLGCQFRRELHLTGDAKFLHKIQGKKLSGDEMPLLEGKSIFQFDARYSLPSWFVVEAEVRPELLRKEVFRIADFVRDNAAKVFEGKPLPESRDDLEAAIKVVFARREFKLHYEFERLAYREVGSSTNERTLIASVLPSRACFSHKLMYLTPCRYSLGAKGVLEQTEFPPQEAQALLTLLNSLTLNFYARSKVSTGVSVHHLYELPIPKLNAADRKRLAAFAARLLKDPHDVKERAALEVFIARDLYGLSLDDWKHLTGTFTFGSGPTKEELDEIIRQSLTLW
jgi:hypothetical protein